MSVKLRLMRMGKTKQPTYRVVAADSRSPRNGRFIDLVGTYEPRREPSAVNLNSEKVEHWLSHGAQPTERVQKILIAEGLLSKEAAGKTVVGKKAAKRPAKQKKPKMSPAETKPTESATGQEASEGSPETSELAPEKTDSAAEETPAEETEAAE